MNARRAAGSMFSIAKMALRHRCSPPPALPVLPPPPPPPRAAPAGAPCGEAGLGVAADPAPPGPGGERPAPGPPRPGRAGAGSGPAGRSGACRDSALWAAGHRSPLRAPAGAARCPQKGAGRPSRGDSLRRRNASRGSLISVVQCVR